MENIREIFQSRGLSALTQAESWAKDSISNKTCRSALSHLMSYWKDYTRPALMSLACESVGGDAGSIKEFSSSLILVGAGIDIHDDIIDQSSRKMNRKTVLGTKGVEITLLLGDALLVEGLVSLAFHLVDQEGSSRKVKQILKVTKDLLLELSDAEAGELELRRKIDITPREYLRLTRMKSADMEAYMRIGAILGNGSEEELEAIARYGRSLGILIILRDDLADMLDFKEELPHRVKYEHLPLPILYAVKNPKYKKKIESLIRRSDIREEEAKQLLKTTYEAEGLVGFEKTIKRIARDCRKELSILPPSEARSILEIVVDVTVPPPLSDLEF